MVGARRTCCEVITTPTRQFTANLLVLFITLIRISPIPHMRHHHGHWTPPSPAALVSSSPWTLALLLAFASSTDNFAVGLSLSLAGAELPMRVNMIVASCNAAGAWVSAALGSAIGPYAPTLAPAGAAAIFAYLAWDELASWRAGESASPLARSAADGLAWKLAAPMTLNNLAGGVASGISGISGVLAGGTALFASVAMSTCRAATRLLTQLPCDCAEKACIRCMRVLLAQWQVAMHSGVSSARASTGQSTHA